MERFWSGTEWTTATRPTQVGLPSPATYGQRYRRRFRVVFLVVLGLLMFGAIGSVGRYYNGIPTSWDGIAALLLDVLVVPLFGSLFWALLLTLVVAAFPGPRPRASVISEQHPSPSTDRGDELSDDLQPPLF